MKNLLLTTALAAVTATSAFADQPAHGSAADTWQHGYEDAAALTIELYENTAEPFAGTPSTFDNLIERFEMAWNGLLGDFNSLKLEHHALNAAHNDAEAALANKTLQIALLQSVVENSGNVEAAVQELYKNTVEPFAGVPSDFDNMIERFEMAWNGLLGDFNNLKVKHKELHEAHSDAEAALASKTLQIALLQSIVEDTKDIEGQVQELYQDTVEDFAGVPSSFGNMLERFEMAWDGLLADFNGLKVENHALNAANNDAEAALANKTLQVALLQSALDKAAEESASKSLKLAALKAELEEAQDAAVGNAVVKIAELESTIADLEADLTDAQDKVTSLEDQYRNLLDYVVELEAAAETGSTKDSLVVEGLLFENETLKAELEAAKAALANKEAHTEALVAAYESTIEGLDADVAKAKELHEGHVNALINANDGVTAELDAEVAALKADLDAAWAVNAELKGEKFALTQALEAANDQVAAANDNADKAKDDGVAETMSKVADVIEGFNPKDADKFRNDAPGFINDLYNYILSIQGK